MDATTKIQRTRQVTKPDGAKTLVRIPSRFANIYFVRRGSFILCTGFAVQPTTTSTTREEGKAALLIASKRKHHQQRFIYPFLLHPAGASTSKSGKVTGELKRVLTREQIKSVKERALWPELFANDDTEYTNKISSDVRRTITPDDLLQVEEKLRIESGGKKKSQRTPQSGAPAHSGFGAEDDDDDGNRICDERSFSQESSSSSSSDDDDSRPPLHKNTNRRRPMSFAERGGRSSSESSSEEESGS